MRARVYQIPNSCLLGILRGEKRIANLPADAELVASDYGPRGLGVRIHSTCFPEVQRGEPLPLVIAIIEGRK